MGLCDRAPIKDMYKLSELNAMIACWELTIWQAPVSSSTFSLHGDVDLCVIYGSQMSVDYRDFGSRISVLDLNPRAQLFGKRLNDACAQTRGCEMRFDRHPYAIIADTQDPVQPGRTVIDSDGAVPLIRESVFKRVDDQLGDDEADANRGVRGDRAVVDRYDQ